ncbi:phthiotriol/phenolphthiotriol dimycocerosates methyltransferase [Mycobacterium sp. 1081908.1]|uniref:phthiotriol/phenolphthiotriol dimycocerosates methyltransferase n=1 Tax=Mycobacterium sp. 1081908.1 TaxID=1834066 RepID=UPI0007FF2D63|nr:class I SAM-dependent methyltransferase [Mycobacterium sp. 1081908.1]OBK43713.1 SAM-dependent methyltransferase [Mycobacterium sp. 1081908.1]
MLKHSAKYHYPWLTRRIESDDVVFLSAGYEEDPPMGLPLDVADEPNRACIQLYHRTAAQVDISGKRVLEVGCGHGGGASYIARHLCPACYTGMDLNPDGVAFCRRTHDVPGVEFVQGDAQDLPFADESFDAVINVESSHSYPDFPGFLREVARVLAPGGHFLYADFRNRNRAAEWEAQLADSPLTMLTRQDINAEVVRGFDQWWISPKTHQVFERVVPAPLRGAIKGAMGAPGPGLYRAVQDGTLSYRMYNFVRS